MPDVIKRSRPNIVFILTDQLRADSCGCFGQASNITPVLDSLAAQGVKFNHAIAAHSLSTAARGILQTGKLASETGCFTLEGTLPQGTKTLAQYLQDAGYKTGYVGQWQLAGHKSICDEHGNVTAETAVEPGERGGYNGFWRAANDLGHTSDLKEGYVFDEQGQKIEFHDGRNAALLGYTNDFLAQVGSDPFFLTFAPFDPMPQRMVRPVEYLHQIYIQYNDKLKANDEATREADKAALKEVQEQEKRFDPKLRAELEEEERQQAEAEAKKAGEQAEAQQAEAQQAEDKTEAADEEDGTVKKLTVDEEESHHWCYLAEEAIIKSLPLRLDPPVNAQIFRPGLIFEYDNYMAQCKQLDNTLGELIESLKAKGLYENTVIIFTAMGGTSFNSRNNDLNCTTKDEDKVRTGTCHYDTVKVPLVIGGGAVATCRPVDDIVSNTSLTRTVLSLAGVEVPADIIGENILALAHTVDSPEAQGPQGPAPEGPNELSLPPHEGTITPGRVQQALVQVSENRLGRAIVTDKFTYAIFAPEVDGSAQVTADHYKDDCLYENFNDPNQIYNKVLDRLYTDDKIQLRAQLLDLIEQTEQQRPTVADAERFYPPQDEEEDKADEDKADQSAE